MLGEQIKALRTERNMTAKDLAARSYVTPGYISQIEREYIRPSNTVLQHIATALDISLEELLAGEKTSEKVELIYKNERTKIQHPTYNVMVEILTPYRRKPDRDTGVEMIRCTLPAGTWGSSEELQHEKENAFCYVLAGNVECHVEGTVYTLKEGDNLFVSAGTCYRVYNCGEEPAELLGVLSKDRG